MSAFNLQAVSLLCIAAKLNLASALSLPLSAMHLREQIMRLAKALSVAPKRGSMNSLVYRCALGEEKIN